MRNLNPTIARALAGFAPRFAQTSCKTHTKPKAQRYSGDLDTTISGIPCLIKIGTVEVHQGNYSPLAETPDEYSGYRDIEFTVLDSKGYPAPWLEAKLNDRDTARIEQEILESMKEEY